MMKNKKIPHSALRIPHSETGFTLIEIAMVLVVLGILITLGIGLVGPLTKRTKLIESREVVKTAKEALSGYAVKYGFLPATDIGLSGARTLDAWGRSLVYALPASLSGSGNACGLTSTDRTIYECTNATCSTSNTKPNIAFIVYSTGEDADGAGTTTKPTAAPACPAGTCYWIREQATSDASYTLDYDDIVQYATLDELRAARGCSFTTTTTLPNAPTAVLATRGGLSSINLTWTAPALATPDSALAGYEIDRSTDAGVTYPLLQSIGMGTSFTDPSLAAGQRYIYRMRTVDKAGNESANSLTSSTTVSPIRQTVALAWTVPGANTACPSALITAVPGCAANRRRVVFTIQNTGNAADNGANITVNSIVVDWLSTGGTVRKIQAPDGITNLYCNAAGTATGLPITLTTPLVINAGASSTLSIYWCASTATQPADVRVQFNTADGKISLY